MIPATAAALTKLRTVRSMPWLLLLTLLIATGLSWLLGTTFGHADTIRSVDDRPFDPLFASFYGLSLAQLCLVTFAVLAVGSEFTTGTIRPALLATPRRGVFYAGNLLALLLPVTAVAAATVLAMFAVAQSALGPRSTSLTAPGVPAALAGAVLYLLLITLFAAGVATTLRGSTLSLGILLPLFFLGSQGLGNVPKLKAVTQYLPDQAGAVAWHLFGQPSDHPFGAGAGLLILTLWTTAALLTGWHSLHSHDT